MGLDRPRPESYYNILKLYRCPRDGCRKWITRERTAPTKSRVQAMHIPRPFCFNRSAHTPQSKVMTDFQYMETRHVYKRRASSSTEHDEVIEVSTDSSSSD